ncbi:RNA-splicing factor [Mortierella sp. GBA35]|nr:RNA-splicing factor [Mortierella sp. GBA35]
MGGGDLNLKKSWHPGTFRNQEKVWKEERKAADEEKKIQQIRKELEEERQIQELQQLREQNGGKKRTDRLDWMYQSAPSAGARDEKDQEDYLLGKRSVDDILKQKAAGGMKSLSKDSDAFMKQVSKANSIKDLQAKVREDPLLAIKKREQASMELLMKNPIKMRQLKESKEGDKDSTKKKKSKRSKEDKADRDERKRDKSERRHKRKSSRDRSDASDESDDSRDSRDGRRPSRKHQRRSPSPPRRISPDGTSKLNVAHDLVRLLAKTPVVAHDLVRPLAKTPVVDHDLDRLLARILVIAHPHLVITEDRHLDQIAATDPDPDLDPQHHQDHHATHDPALHNTSVLRGHESPHHDATAGRAQDQGRHQQQQQGRAHQNQQEDQEEVAAKKRAALLEDRARRLKAMTDDASAEDTARKARLAEIAEFEAKQDAEEEAKRAKTFNGEQASFMKSAQKAAYSGSMSLADRVQRGRTTLRND